MGIFDEKIAEDFKVHKYEPPRHIVDFHVAGFAYYDGLDVINELSLGQAVTLVVETDNPYDNEAVAIYYKDKKLGYVPKEKNSFLTISSKKSPTSISRGWIAFLFSWNFIKNMIQLNRLKIIRKRNFYY